MDEKRTIIKVAEGNFPFHFFIQKAIPSMEAGQMIVEGVASTPNVDHDKERMSVEALKSMASIINKQGVPLRVEHSQADNAIIGNVNKAWIDDRNNLWIKAVLDEKHPAAGILYKGLKEGVKMGLSVGGYVRRAVQEMVEGLGKSVNTFYDVLLDEVSVTQKPSNYDARLMAKSFAKSEGEVDALAGLFESNEFLFHSAMGESNYLTAFSKSIPESEWKDVDENYKLDINKSMDNKDEEKTTKAEESEETKTTKAAEETGEEKTTKASEKDEEKTEKSVSRAEFNDLVKMVSQGFNGLTHAIGKMAKAMDTDAKVQANPGKEMEDINNEGKTVKASGGDAVDQEQPNKKKEDPEEGKGMGKSSEEEKTEKANDDTYDLETVERAIKTIQDFNKGGDDDTEKTTKASDDSEKVTKSQVSAIDRFAIEVATAIEKMQETMKKGGFQTNHIAKSVINEIRSNPDYQKDIAEFMKEPSQKRSVINGTPFVKTKDGNMYRLTLENTGGERTERSTKEIVAGPGAFKAAWGANFSSQKQSE